MKDREKQNSVCGLSPESSLSMNNAHRILPAQLHCYINLLKVTIILLKSWLALFQYMEAIPLESLWGTVLISIKKHLSFCFQRNVGKEEYAGNRCTDLNPATTGQILIHTASDMRTNNRLSRFYCTNTQIRRYIQHLNYSN